MESSREIPDLECSINGQKRRLLLEQGQFRHRIDCSPFLQPGINHIVCRCPAGLPEAQQLKFYLEFP